MKHLRLCCLIAFSCAVLFIPSAVAPGQARPANLPANLSVEDRAYIASRIYAALEYFAHWQGVPDFNVDAAYRSYLAKALAAPDRAAFDRASMEFLASFKNAHTAFLDHTAIQQGGALPFVAQLLNGKWVVTESWVTGLKAGDTIDSIDGKPFGQFVQDCLQFVSASTDEGRRRLLFARTPGMSPYAHLFPEQFALTLAGGKTMQVDRGDLAEAEPLATEGRWLEQDKIAYIRIPSFMGPEFEKMALDLAQEYRNAAALIVDVRGNSGGSTPEKLTAFLMDRPYRWWSEAVPVNIPFLQMKLAQGQSDYWLFRQSSLQWSSSPQQPAREHFGRTLVLLADAGCMSACEDFLMPFKDSYRALIVGETTSGSSGQPYQMDLGSGITVMIGAKRESFPDGAPFEGVGIRPDMDVSPTVEDLRAGRDTILEAARKSLQRTK